MSVVVVLWICWFCECWWWGVSLKGVLFFSILGWELCFVLDFFLICLFWWCGLEIVDEVFFLFCWRGLFCEDVFFCWWVWWLVVFKVVLVILLIDVFFVEIVFIVCLLRYMICGVILVINLCRGFLFRLLCNGFFNRLIVWREL